MKSLTPLPMYLRYSSQSLLLYTRRSSRVRGPITHYYHSISSPRRNVKVSVWWDFENCGIPNGMDALQVPKNITAALRANGIQGPVAITAFGDFIRLPRLVQEKLSLTGVSFNHVPGGGKNAADRSLLADLVFWVSQNPPPAYMFLISSDQDFADILHRLRMNNYNVLLASMDPVSGVLASAASITWCWSQLVRGESLRGRHFNEPPDGPLGSWYSHNGKPLEGFLPDMGRPPCVQAEGSRNSVFGSKICKVPSATVSQIRRLVNIYPDGVDISEFRSELLRRNVTLDRNLYGHKKFSLLLKSLPNVLKLQYTGEGRIIVKSIKRKIAEPVVQKKVAEPDDQRKVTTTCAQPKVAELSDCKWGEYTKSEVNSANRTRIATAESNDRKDAPTADFNEKSSLSAYSPSKIESHSVVTREGDLHLTEPCATERNYSNPKVGFFQRVWGNVFSQNGETSNKKRNISPEMCCTSADSSLFSKESVSGEETAINSEERDKSIPKMSIFGIIMKLCVSGKTSTKPDNPNGNIRGDGASEMSSESDQRRNSLYAEAANADTGKVQMNIQTDDSELFSEVAFWEGVLSFLHTPKGESLITQSKSRRQIVEKLQKEGPSHLNNLVIGDLNHLVDLLIYEKKWIEETVSNAFPFKLILPVQTISPPSDPHRSNELSSMFLDKTSLSNLRRPLDNEWENKKKKDTPSEVCLDVSNNGLPSGRYKSEMLADCTSLVADMLNENPEGFDTNIFKKCFYKRYGYQLITQRLGYLILAPLLRSIPGVVVRGRLILSSEKSLKAVIPYNIANDGSEKKSVPEPEWSESIRKTHDPEDEWKSLQPILETDSRRNCLRSGTTMDKNEGIIHVDYGDSIYLSEEDSDSDGESPIRDPSDGERVANCSKEESPLLQMLDLYYGGSDKDKKDRHSSNNGLGYRSRIDLKSSFEFGWKRTLKTPFC